jgi:hypothetical protein
MPPPAEIDFREVLGILRLSYKYDVPYLFKRAILSNLGKHHSKSLDEYTDNLHYKNGATTLDLEAIPILQ